RDRVQGVRPRAARRGYRRRAHGRPGTLDQGPALMQRIAVVDFGTGNLHSVGKALERVAPKAAVGVTRDPRAIDAADRVVLPGQGAMGSWFAAMEQFALGDSVRGALGRVPVLGICLGLQALLERSDEDGGTSGLGVFAGDVPRFRAPTGGVERFKIPHMGWNRVRQA